MDSEINPPAKLVQNADDIRIFFAKKLTENVKKTLGKQWKFHLFFCQLNIEN